MRANLHEKYITITGSLKGMTSGRVDDLEQPSLEAIARSDQKFHIRSCAYSVWTRLWDILSYPFDTLSGQYVSDRNLASNL